MTRRRAQPAEAENPGGKLRPTRNLGHHTFDERAHSTEEIMAHPFHWAYLTERDTEEVLLELYVARRMKMQ